MRFQSNKTIRRSAWIGAGIGFLLFLILRFAFCSEGEGSVDCFYHIRIGLEGWRVFAAKTFPTLILSSWTECFADKELLFHLLVGGVQRFSLFLGLPEFPFHLPGLFFPALVLIAFTLTGIHFRIRGLALLTPLLVAGFSIFTFRLLLIRPHLLAVALLLLSCIAFSRIRRLWDGWLGILFGILFVWSYSNPHFLLMTAGAFGAAWFFRDKQRGCIIFFSALIGLLAGFVLHPQCPNTFINWKIQCIDVPLFMMRNDVPVELGQEMTLVPYRLFCENPLLFLPFLLLLSANITLTVLWFRRKGKMWFRPNLFAGMLLWCVTTLGFVFVYRFIEYAMPFNLLYLGMIGTRVSGAAFPFPRRFRLAGCALVLALGFGMVFFVNYNDSLRFRQRPLTHLAAWFDSFGGSVPKGLVIANLSWSDFPQLYYSLPRFRYLYGLDPTFGYFYKKEIVAKLEAFMPSVNLSPTELMNLTGSPLFYLSPHYEKQAKKMYDAGFRMIYQGDDGWVFSAFGSGQKQKSAR